MLGEWHRDQARAVETTSPTDTDGSTTAPTSPPSGCPDEMKRTAVSQGFSSDLRQELKIVTDKGTTVWICEDPEGSLYYQGKTGGVDAPLVQTTNGLFLSSVIRRDTDEYEAKATNGNRILVSRDRLEVHFADGRPTQIDKVETAE